MSESASEQAFGSPSGLARIEDRRREFRPESSTSSRSVSLEAALLQNLRLEDKLKADADNLSPKETLKRFLSVRSVISTTSSTAEQYQAAVGRVTPFREIGTGSIGKVFEHPGTIWAYKLPLLDKSDKLWNNYVMHVRVQDSFDKLGNLSGLVEIPRCAWFASPESEFWSDNLDLFPSTQEFPRKPRQVLCMERIFPLPQPVRETLIDIFVGQRT